MNSNLTLALGAFLNNLSAREERILRVRIWAGTKRKLDSIGEELGVTRERVRQVEVQLTKKISDSGVENIIRGEIINQLKAIDADSFSITLAEASHLILLNLGLGEFEFSLGDIAEFTGQFEVDSTFLYFPNKRTVGERLLELSEASEGGRVMNLRELESLRLQLGFCLRLDSMEFEDLIKALSWSVHSNYCYSPGLTKFEDKFFVYLQKKGAPIIFAEAMKDDFSDFSIRSSLNRVRLDSRFIFPDQGMVKIREADEVGMKTIGDLIEEALAGKDSLTVAAVTEFVLSQRQAAISSIRAYANTFPFATNRGVVSRISRPKPPKAYVAKTKRLYRTSSGWRIRIPINAELMRGSSAQLPTSVIRALALPAEGRKQYWSSLLEQEVWVAWQGLQPKIQAVKKVVEKLGGDVGHHLLVDFSNVDNTVSFLIVEYPPQSKGVQGLCELFGVSSNDSQVQELSRLLMADLLGGLSVVEILKARREYDAIDVYEGVAN
jgi:hypothetical protein